MSTAYHPQTDSQSEALNRIIEHYLRAYASEDPTARLLPLAQFAFDCKIRIDIADNVAERRIPAANVSKNFHQLRERLHGRLIEAQERTAWYYDENHVPMQFEVGDFIKLSTKHRKMSPRWVGPFRVLERIGGQAYRLALPDKYSRLHDVFPVQLLEEYRRRDDDDSLMTMPDLEDPQDEWEVEEVLDKRRIKDTIYYLVKWAGWPSEYNSYEPAAHMDNAPQAIAAFERRLKRKRRRSDA